MNIKLSPLITAFIFGAACSQASARPDTLGEYDENSIQTNSPDAYFTNHAGGYSGFVADIASYWNSDKAGVNDEFIPHSNQNLTLSGAPYTFGYGMSGYYNPADPASSQGLTITLDDGSYDWDWTNKSPSISGEFTMSLGAKSLGTGITVASSDSAPVLIAGFTVLGNTLGNVTATINYSDKSSYTETFTPSRLGDVFFGGVAGPGVGIDSFTLTSDSEDQMVYLDDLAFSTGAASLAQAPEASAALLSLLGFMGLMRRRR